MRMEKEFGVRWCGLITCFDAKNWYYHDIVPKNWEVAEGRSEESLALIEENIFGITNKVAQAIARIKLNEPKNGIGYDVQFSGGKDSCVVYDLVKRAGVKYRVSYCLTTVDPPELVRFIKEQYPEVTWVKPKRTMWELIEKKGFLPIPQIRYCCKELKESFRPPDGGAIVTGVRWAESARRAKRNPVETCMSKAKSYFVHPIIEWSDDEVWEYIKKYNVSYCNLYDQGYKRLGCILCPFQSAKARARDIAEYPKYVENYKKAFFRSDNWKPAPLTETQRAEGLKPIVSKEEEWEWWLSQGYRNRKPTDVNSESLFEFRIDKDENFL